MSHGSILAVETNLSREMREPDRADAPWARELPAIVVGGRAQRSEVLRACEAGADDFLARPIRYLG